MIAANTVIDRCGSTNDLARSLGEAGYPHGTWISARVQESGRGRLGREWMSIEGNLFLSMVLRLPDKSIWSWVPLTCAVGAARALRAINPRLDLRIKWPNDLWVGTAKAGGILCEALGTREQSFIVMGIGLNCVSAPEPGTIDQPAAAIGASADEVRLPVITYMLEALEELRSLGRTGIASDYERWAAASVGTEIHWGDDKSGTVLGLGESGELLVSTPAGNQKLYAEDVKIRISR